MGAHHGGIEHLRQMRRLAHRRQGIEERFESGGSELTIRIEGGLPSLPGSSVIMPGQEPKNGRALNRHSGPVIERPLAQKPC
jgi:hypothetical protein